MEDCTQGLMLTDCRDGERGLIAIEDRDMA